MVGRCYTRKEVIDQMMEQIDLLAQYWTDQDVSERRRCEGMAFSILNMIDGTTGIPKLYLTIENQATNGNSTTDPNKNYYENGMVVNTGNIELHGKMIKREAE